MIASIKSQLFGAPEDLWEPETKVHKWFKSWLIGPPKLSLYVSTRRYNGSREIDFLFHIGEHIFIHRIHI